MEWNSSAHLHQKIMEITRNKTTYTVQVNEYSIIPCISV